MRPAGRGAVRHHRAMASQPIGPHRIAVLDDYLDVARDLAPWSSLPGCDVTFFTEPIGDATRLVEVLAPFDIVCAMRERTPLPVAVLERLPNLRLLVTTGMQNAAIDVDAAARGGVVVCGTPSRASATVEMTWALILAAARHVPAHDRAIREGGWQRHLGLGLAGRRLGVIGLGKNGSAVARLGVAFGMDVVAWSQNLSSTRADEVGVQRVERDELLSTSDVVTIHLRLSDRTVNLLDRDALALMDRRRSSSIRPAGRSSTSPPCSRRSTPGDPPLRQSMSTTRNRCRPAIPSGRETTSCSRRTRAT